MAQYQISPLESAFWSAAKTTGIRYPAFPEVSKRQNRKELRVEVPFYERDEINVAAKSRGEKLISR